MELKRFWAKLRESQLWIFLSNKPIIKGQNYKSINSKFTVYSVTIYPNQICLLQSFRNSSV